MISSTGDHPPRLLLFRLMARGELEAAGPVGLRDFRCPLGRSHSVFGRNKRRGVTPDRNLTVRFLLLKSKRESISSHVRSFPPRIALILTRFRPFFFENASGSVYAFSVFFSLLS